MVSFAVQKIVSLIRSHWFIYLFIYLFPFFVGPHPLQMEFPRLWVKSEIQLPAFTTATATQDLSRVCSLHHGSQLCRIFNPLSKARDQTQNLMIPSWIHFCCATMGTLHWFIFVFISFALETDLRKHLYG